MTIDHKQVIPSRPSGGSIGEPGHSERHVPVVLPDRDVRRKRPPLLSFLLRRETLRRISRVITLLVLDFLGVLGAIFTALALKLALRGHFDATARPGATPARRWRSPIC